jgi:hypothetical protein
LVSPQDARLTCPGFFPQADFFACLPHKERILHSLVGPTSVTSSLSVNSLLICTDSF